MASFRFAMKGEDQWRVESRDANGNVKGRYVYKTPDGQKVDVSYDAGPQGYRARGDAIPGGAAPLVQEEETVEVETPTLYQPDEDLRVASPYGALRVAGQQATMPSGEGITTFSDSEASAIVTDIVDDQSQSQFVIYPVVTNFLGTKGPVVGPPIVSNKPVLPAAILV